MNKGRTDHNTFKDKKSLAYKAAEGLGYSQKILDRIKNATTEGELERASSAGRAELDNKKFDKHMKD